MEESAGASFDGPDARTLQFTFDRQETYAQPYLTVIFDGFQSADEARNEMFTFALGHPFNVLGNPVRLQRSSNLTLR